MKILITGGAGYIGTHVAEALISQRHEVTVFDDFSKSDIANVHPNAQLGIGDVTRYHDLQVVIDDMEEVDAIIHLAGRIEVGESVKYPMLFSKQNIVGTCNVVRACEFNAIPILLYASSAGVYASPEVAEPMGEGAEIFPTNPYAHTKFIGEEMVRSAGLATCCFRFFNAAGATPALGFGERHDPETHLIPLAVQACLRGTTLKVFGDDYSTPDGTCVRDYVHVKDIANAFVLALKEIPRHIESAVKQELDPMIDWVLNLGTSRGASVLEVVHMVERTMRRPLKWTVEPRREGDPPYLVADASAARKLLGWKPKNSKLMKIVQDAVDFAML